MNPPTPVTLEGWGVRLEPLTREHHDGLVAAASDGELWNLFYTSVPEPEQVHAYISGALAGQALGSQLFGHPNAVATLVLAVVGAIAAVKVQRYVIVIGTAFIGAQTAVAGAVALAGARGPRPRGAEPVWIGHVGMRVQ